MQNECLKVKCGSAKWPAEDEGKGVGWRARGGGGRGRVGSGTREGGRRRRWIVRAYLMRRAISPDPSRTAFLYWFEFE